MRSTTATSAPEAITDPVSVDAIVTEVGRWIGELRCSQMSQLVQSQVSHSQMHVLWLLQHHGEMSMSRLAELLGVSLSNATGIIDRMEEHALIERVRVPDDRRLVLVRPAANGLRELSQTESSKRERLRAVIGHLSAPERVLVLQALRSLRRGLTAEAEANPTHHHHFADATH